MKKHIRNYYEQLYQGKKGGKAFKLGGKSLAAELGYPFGLIDSLPDDIWRDFLPCGNVFPFLNPKPGERVLNLGCGAGVDSVALKLTFGAELAVVNLDASMSALRKVRGFAERSFRGFESESVCADGESLPFEPCSFEWVILNGVFNLFPEKNGLIAELFRVLKPGGVAAGADLSRRGVLPDYFASEPDAWAWCMSGAMSVNELNTAFEACGFTKLHFVVESMDEYFDRAVFVFRKSG